MGDYEEDITEGGSVGGGSVGGTEGFDNHELHELVFATSLGVDLEEDFAPELVDLAAEALYVLPEGWEVRFVEADMGKLPYFFDAVNNKKYWTHPFVEDLKNLVIEKRVELAEEIGSYVSLDTLSQSQVNEGSLEQMKERRVRISPRSKPTTDIKSVDSNLRSNEPSEVVDSSRKSVDSEKLAVVETKSEEVFVKELVEEEIVKSDPIIQSKTPLKDQPIKMDIYILNEVDDQIAPIMMPEKEPEEPFPEALQKQEQSQQQANQLQEELQRKEQERLAETSKMIPSFAVHFIEQTLQSAEEEIIKKNRIVQEKEQEEKLRAAQAEEEQKEKSIQAEIAAALEKEKERAKQINTSSVAFIDQMLEQATVIAQQSLERVAELQRMDKEETQMRLEDAAATEQRQKIKEATAVLLEEQRKLAEELAQKQLAEKIKVLEEERKMQIEEIFEGMITKLIEIREREEKEEQEKERQLLENEDISVLSAEEIQSLRSKEELEEEEADNISLKSAASKRSLKSIKDRSIAGEEKSMTSSKHKILFVKDEKPQFVPKSLFKDDFPDFFKIEKTMFNEITASPVKKTIPQISPALSIETTTSQKSGGAKKQSKKGRKESGFALLSPKASSQQLQQQQLKQQQQQEIPRQEQEEEEGLDIDHIIRLNRGRLSSEVSSVGGLHSLYDDQDSTSALSAAFSETIQPGIILSSVPQDDELELIAPTTTTAFDHPSVPEDMSLVSERLMNLLGEDRFPQLPPSELDKTIDIKDHFRNMFKTEEKEEDQEQEGDEDENITRGKAANKKKILKKKRTLTDDLAGNDGGIDSLMQRKTFRALFQKTGKENDNGDGLGASNHMKMMKKVAVISKEYALDNLHSLLSLTGENIRTSVEGVDPSEENFEELMKRYKSPPKKTALITTTTTITNKKKQNNRSTSIPGLGLGNDWIVIEAYNSYRDAEAAVAFLKSFYPVQPINREIISCASKLLPEMVEITNQKYQQIELEKQRLNLASTGQLPVGSSTLPLPTSTSTAVFSPNKLHSSSFRNDKNNPPPTPLDPKAELLKKLKSFEMIQKSSVKNISLEKELPKLRITRDFSKMQWLIECNDKSVKRLFVQRLQKKLPPSPSKRTHQMTTTMKQVTQQQANDDLSLVGDDEEELEDSLDNLKNTHHHGSGFGNSSNNNNNNNNPAGEYQASFTLKSFMSSSNSKHVSSLMPISYHIPKAQLQKLKTIGSPVKDPNSPGFYRRNNTSQGRRAKLTSAGKLSMLSSHIQSLSSLKNLQSIDPSISSAQPMTTMQRVNGSGGGEEFDANNYLSNSKSFSALIIPRTKA
jgi:hypothetical protein